MNKPFTAELLTKEFGPEFAGLADRLNQIVSEQSGWVKCSDRLPTKEDASPVSNELLTDADYWKQRCLLAETCIEECPCDPDITPDQIKAHNAYHKFISWAGIR